jgi:hypothetical protein
VSRPTASPSAFDLALKRWQVLPPFLDEVDPSQIAKVSRPRSDPPSRGLSPSPSPRLERGDGQSCVPQSRPIPPVPSHHVFVWFDLSSKRWQVLPPFPNEVVPSQIAKVSCPTSPRSHPCTVSDQLLPHAQCEPPLFKRHPEGQASPAFAQGASIDFTTKNTANRPRVSMRVETTLKVFPQSRESRRSRRLKPREGRHSRCHGREPVECWRCAAGKSPSGATLLPAERVAPFRGLKTQTSKFGPPVTNRLHLGRKALVRRRLKHSSIEVDCDAHFSQADSFAVVREPTAEPSAWETERGRCFHDHQCNQRLSQGLTADVQYVVTPMARGVPPIWG